MRHTVHRKVFFNQKEVNMARQTITAKTIDPVSDSGSVIWSIVKGEQLEFPVTLDFLSNAGIPNTYTYEAVVLEAANELGSTTIPNAIQPSGIQTPLVVRVPLERGAWVAGTAYNREDVVFYNEVYYKLALGTARVNSTPPDIDTAYWEIYVPNKVYIQLPANLGSTYLVSPSVGAPVYGFLELRVIEPSGDVFQHAWKPVRGLVELLFSPTDLVPDWNSLLAGTPAAVDGSNVVTDVILASGTLPASVTTLVANSLMGVPLDTTINKPVTAASLNGGTLPASVTTMAISAAIPDNDSDTSGATTAFVQSQIANNNNPTAIAQSINMTAASSGSNGIQIADNANIDFGTGNFTLHWEGSLPDWTSSVNQYFIFKHAANVGYWLTYRQVVYCVLESMKIPIQAPYLLT